MGQVWQPLRVNVRVGKQVLVAMEAVGAVARYPGLFVATGHAMMGLTLGPVTGKLISECVLDGSPSITQSKFGSVKMQMPPCFRTRPIS
jgi:hypothetical protein